MQTELTVEIKKSSSNYREQWDSMRSDHPALNAICNIINGKQGNVLILGHDDADGVASGLILKRMFQKKGWQASVVFPEKFTLTQKQLDQAIKQYPQTEAVFVVDKGTLPEYSFFGKQLPVYIVDHHPSAEPPVNCIFFNPAMEKYVPCSSSMLCHGIATLVDAADDFDDFLSLIGMKADWVIEPVTGIFPDFAKPFFSEHGVKFKNLFEIISDKPTIYEVEQREKTCLLNRISEFAQAATGSGFQYFYHGRDSALKNVNHPQCMADALEKLSSKMEQLKKFTKFEEFLRMLPEPERSSLNKIYACFIEDWESAENLLDSTAKILHLGDTSIYLFTGAEVPLLPMIGSVKLLKLKQSAQDKYALIVMANSISSSEIHVSVRTTGDQIHSGKFCSQLASRLKKEFPQYQKLISGGGHPRAAECTTSASQVSFLNVLTEVMGQLNEMKDLASKFSKISAVPPNAGSSFRVSEEDKSRAQELGLDYLAF